MNWFQIIINTAGAFATAFAASQIIPEPFNSAFLAVAGILVGLFQKQPHKQS